MPKKTGNRFGGLTGRMGRPGPSLGGAGMLNAGMGFGGCTLSLTGAVDEIVEPIASASA